MGKPFDQDDAEAFEGEGAHAVPPSCSNRRMAPEWPQAAHRAGLPGSQSFLPSRDASAKAPSSQTRIRTRPQNIEPVYVVAFGQLILKKLVIEISLCRNENLLGMKPAVRNSGVAALKFQGCVDAGRNQPDGLEVKIALAAGAYAALD